MSKDPHTIVHRWFNEVWNQGREETVDELYAADGIAHGLGEGNDVRGPGEFKIFLHNMRSALPDATVRIEDTIIDGSKAVVRLVLEGTHLGDGLGMPKTGRRVSVSGIVIIQTADGQIVEGWNSWDQLGLLQQLGAMPIQKEADRFLAAP